MKKRLLFTIFLLFSCSINTSSDNSQHESISSNRYSEILTGVSSEKENDNISSDTFTMSSKESSSDEESSQSNVSSSLKTSNITSSSSSSVSSSSSEQIVPVKQYDYLEGVLYGDDAFVEKCRKMKNREIETVDDIPDSAIFVSLSGNDSHDGTINNPLKTLSKALEKTSSLIKNNKKAVIIMREGTYEPTHFYGSAKGNKDNYVVITNYPGEEVKISPKNNSAETIGLFHFGTSSYFIIEGLKFCDNIGTSVAKALSIDGKGGGNHIIIKHNEIYNIRVTNTGSSANAPLCSFRGIGDKSLNNILIYDNYIHDCTCGYSEAITMVGNVENSNIIQNTIKETGNIGIDVAGNYNTAPAGKDQARNVVVRGNDVSGENSPYARSYAIYVDGAKDTIFENNRVYNSQGGIEIGSEEGLEHKDYPVKNITVRNNLVFNNSQQGITIGGYNPDCAYYCENVSVYNNTVVDNGEKNSGQIKISMVDGLKIYNNILFSSNNYSLFSGELDEKYSKNVELRNNIFYSSTDKDSAYFKPYSQKTIGFDNFLKKFNNAGTYVNPNFKDINNLDFSLNTDSFAINNAYETGIDAGLYDMNKNHRYVNNLDIGAYEYQN